MQSMPMVRSTRRNPSVRIAAGEGSNTYRMAEDIIVHGGIEFVQIDAGRIGGILPSFQVRQLAEPARYPSTSTTRLRAT